MASESFSLDKPITIEGGGVIARYRAVYILTLYIILLKNRHLPGAPPSIGDAIA
jgi:hypothetical protein